MTIKRTRLDEGVNLIPTDTILDKEGDLSVSITDKELKVQLDSATRTVVTEDQIQELTNKTIDADVNPISNLEVDNFKAGVLNTSTTLAGATDTQVPSALATKTLANSVQANLTAHINETTDAHDASAISVSPIVGVSGSEVQSVLSDLKSQIDSAAGDAEWGGITGTLSDQTDLQSALDSKATNSTVSTLSGRVDDLETLSGVPANSTDLGSFTGTTIPDNSTIKGALQSLETSVETKANSSTLTAHTSASSGVHGVTGSVVGTTDTQTLTNKTLTSPTINGGSLTNASVVTPSQSDVKQDTFANLVTYASTATNGQLVFATDNKKMYQIVDGTLSDVGGGGQTLDNLFQLTADEPVGDWTNLDGGFSISKVNPIQGEASYVLDMTNLYSATHKVIPVDEVFRGKTLAITLNYVMEQGAARIALLDQTNTIIEGTTFDLALGSGIQKFGTTVFIPSTVTGIRFQMEARATVASQSIKFDNVQVSSDLLKSVNIADQYQQFGGEGTVIAVNTASPYTAPLNTPVKGNSSLLTMINGASGTEWVANRDVEISIFFGASVTTAGGTINVIIDGVRVASSGSTHNANQGEQVGFRGLMKQGQRLKVGGPTLSSTSIRFTILATARTESIVAPTDQVTERSIAFKFKSTALTASDPIGTYNTYTYAANTNTKTLASTRPTQTDADMSVNGFRIFTRAYNASSTAAQPARFEIKIAEPNQMSSMSMIAYKSTSRDITSTLDFFAYGAFQFGTQIKNFNPATGILTIDLGFNDNASSTTTSSIRFSDGSSQNNGYLTFTASKLAQGVAIPTPARYVVKFIESGSNWATVYNDGWVEQAGHLPVGTTGTATSSLLISMKDTLYTLTPSVENLTSFNNPVGGKYSSYEGKTTSTVSMWRDPVISRPWKVEGWGASSVVKQYGANPAYV